MENNRNTIPLIVFAKVPVFGTVKTRIAGSEGHDRAFAIYRELLMKTAANVAHLPCHVAYTGQKHPAELSDIFTDAISFFPQTPGNLGERMRAAFSTLFAAGHRAAVLIGCDIPTITPSLLSGACAALHQTDVVIGPAEDGGYYLIGCNASSLAVFDVDAWGKNELYSETMGLIRNNSFHYTELPMLYDIDSIADYRRWIQSATAKRWVT